MGEPNRPRSSRGIDLCVAVVLAVVGAAMRSGSLGPSSLWLDDAWLALSTRADSVADAMTTGLTSPGFAVLLGWVTDLFGFSETRAQLLPFVLGVATPVLVFLVARHAGLPLAAATLGAAVLVAAPFHLTYSTRVKPYTADAFLATVVLWTGWRVLARPEAGRRWVVFLGTACAAVVISAGSAPTVLAVAVAATWAAHRRRSLHVAVPVLAALAVVAAVWWIAAVSPALTPQLKNHWSGFFTATNLPHVLRDIVALPSPGALALFAASAVIVARRDRVLAVMLITPIVTSALLAGLRLAPMGGGRVDVHLYPSLALLVAVAAGSVRVPLRSLGCLGLAAVLLLRAPPPAPYPQDDVRPLIRHVEKTEVPILVYPTTRWAYALYTRYPVEIRRDRSFSTGFAVEIDSPRVSVLTSQRRMPDRHRPAVTTAAAPLDRLWLVVTQTRPDLVAIEETLQEMGFRVTTTLTRPGASAALWER